MSIAATIKNPSIMNRISFHSFSPFFVFRRFSRLPATLFLLPCLKDGTFLAWVESFFFYVLVCAEP